MATIISFFKKITASVLSLFIAFSVFTGVSFTASAYTPCTPDFTAATAVATAKKNSLIVSAPSVNFYRRAKTTDAWQKMMCGMPSHGVLHDGTFYYSTNNAIGKLGETERSFGEYSSDYKTVTKYYTDGKYRYATVTYDLGTVCDISNILIAGRNDKSKCIGVYALYASIMPEDLFESTSLLYNYDYKNNATGNENPTNYEPYMYQTYSCNYIYARFVSIKVTMPSIGDCIGTTNLANAVINLSEFNVYGTKKYSGTLTSNSFTKNSELFSGIKASVVTSAPTAIGHIVNSDSSVTDKNLGTASTAVCDSDIESGSHYMPSSFKFSTRDESDGKAEGESLATGYYTDGTKQYLDLIYDFKKEKKIKNIIISNHPSDILRMSRYYVYASDDRDTLFDSKNIVYAYEAVGAVPKNQIFTFANNTTTARCVAMRVFNPVGSSDESVLKANPITKLYTNDYLRLFEFNVFGFESYQTSGSMASIDEYDKTLSGLHSLIANRSASDAFLYKDGNRLSLSEANYNFTEDGERYSTTAQYPYFSILTDGSCKHDDEIHGTGLYFSDNNKVLQDDESKMYCQFNYPLDYEADISSVELYGHPNANLSPSHYRLSVADTEDKLFTAQAEYESSDIYSNVGSLSRVTFETPIRGKFVGIRIICGISPDAVNSYGYSSLYLRLSEFSVLGAYVSAAGEITSYNSINTPSGIKKQAGTATVSYDCVPDKEGNYSSEALAHLKAKASVRYNKVLYSFLNWTDKNGNIISEDLKIDVETDAVVTANYGTSSKVVKITFCDNTGNSVYTTNVPFGNYLTKEQYTAANNSVGEIAGYRRMYSAVEFGSRTAEMPTWNADIYNYAAEADITFMPLYEAEDTLYTVSYGGDTKSLKFDTRVTYTDTSASYWTVNGLKWCSGTKFQAYVAGDMEIKSATGTNNTYVSLYNKAYIGESTLGVMAKLSLPQNAVITQCGVLFLSGDYLKTTDYTMNLYNSLKISNSSAQKVVAKAPTDSSYMVTLTGVGRKHTRVARAFVTYSLSGNSYTVYSNVVTATMN